MRFAWEEEPTGFERNQLHAFSEIAASEWPVLFMSYFRCFLLSQVNTVSAMLNDSKMIPEPQF